jgi:class 3 adenylate cyclase/tetratricopeptide (TPR) repeat protein
LQILCPACGTRSAPGRRFCGDCGAALDARAGAASATRAEGERRQLTVMFCDLVGSTVLANRLDPEDWQDVIRAYHAAVSAAVGPFAGHAAQLLGDGVLVYFGYPRAHEDDAPRAVRAALAVLDSVAALQSHADVSLQARIGIATGVVVVGEIGAGTPAAERSASGDAPNLAARLQSHAAPGEILISDHTRKLVGIAFALDSLGPLALKGFAAPVRAWRVCGERVLASRFEAQHEAALFDFVGRESEVALLRERWDLAHDGEGQVVLLTGEPGIGKSRTCQVLREGLSPGTFATVLLQCSPYHGNSALHPVVQHLARTACIGPSDPPVARAEKVARLAGTLAEDLLGALLRMMGLPDGGRPASASPQHEKMQTMQALEELLRRLSQQQPVLYLVEDAHWIDPSTDELIGQTVEWLRDARVLMLITARPEYQPGWASPASFTHLRLSRLGQRQCAALVSSVAGGKPLPADVLTEVIRKTDGVPLFVEELTKTVLQSGQIEETAERYELKGPLPSLAIPATLQDSLMARLDRLSPVKEVAQAGAVIGREFPRRLLGAVLDTMPADRLDAALDELVRAELVFRKGVGGDASYSFKHALIRDTAYASLLKSQRALRHAQIAAALENTDAVATRPELIAHHHQEAGEIEAGFAQWVRAGDLSGQRSSSVEAQAHYEAALALLAKTEPGRHNQERELGVLVRVGQMIFQSEGFTSVRARTAAVRARELALALDQPDAYVQISAQLANLVFAGGRLQEGIAILEELPPDWSARAQPVSRARRAVNLGMAWMALGNQPQAWAAAAETRHWLEAAGSTGAMLWAGAAPSVASLVLCSWIRTRQGLLAQAEAYADQAARTACQLGHAHSRAFALLFEGRALLLRGDLAAAHERARQSLELSERIGFLAIEAFAVALVGTTLIATGAIDEGVRLSRRGLDLGRKVWGHWFIVDLATSAADALLVAGCQDEAAGFVAAGEQLQSETEERVATAELLRLRAALRQRAGDHEGAMQDYISAFELAESQGSKLYSLRAATDLAALYRSLGRPGRANAVLRPIYEWFTEGLDYPDVTRAKALLDE